MNVVEERHSTIVVEEVYQNPPQQRNGVAQGFVINNEPSAPPPPPPPPPPITVVNTNVYVNPGEYVKEVTGYVAVISEPDLPCCGIGVGWFLFIVGWLLCGIPWYVGAIILLCSKVDPREKPGYIACSIIAIIVTILAIIMAATGKDYQ
ncbi:hypothetical protein P3X46_004963 [Hevea brasiliensis]|uniref:60S ribosomal protein L18a-like protein n=1 Tax=Hevea brasiliensis TaxID=3981 RepID=A0ABQ9MYC8_HEVBR|nr:60S ribosomal protein L18a-like protein [Hevea brasiliensis]KAJ9185314.1 hypothetical protein P3X46_004963 [Hevea brasiliensis]